MIGSLFFGFYIVFIAGVYLCSSKRAALILNTLCCSSCAIYLYTVDGYAGVIACIAAASGSLYQLYLYNGTRQEITRKTLLYKLVGSTCFAIIGILAIYQTPSDLLLAFAIIICRGSEMFDNARFVKLGYVFAEALWFVYAADHGFVGMYTIHLCMASTGLYILYRRKTGHILSELNRYFDLLHKRYLDAQQARIKI